MKTLILLVSFLFAFKTSALSNEFSTMDGPREWTDLRGNKLTASWETVSKDGTIVWLKEDGKKPMKLPVSRLSSADQKFISDAINLMKNSGHLWIDGVWMAPLSIREMNYVKKARSLVHEKSPRDLISFRVFQVISYGALCETGKKLSHSDTVLYSGPLFYWNVGENNMVASEETYRDKRFYWAGTFQYEMKKGGINTVLWYVENFDRAVYLVRGKFGLFDKGDKRFADFDKSGNIPPSTSSSPLPNNDVKTVSAYGSGFFISTNGFIITNHHVVDGGKQFSILCDHGEFPAKLIAKDANSDLAVLKTEGIFSALPLSSDKTARLGQDIFVMGFPRPDDQGFSPKVTKGVISSLKGLNDNPTRYQIDASIQPGNSGGPVCDSSGNLVAVTVSSLNAKFFLNHDGTVPQNVNYAIKKSYLLAFLDSIPECSMRGFTTATTYSTFEDAVSFVQKCVVLIKVY